MASISKQLEGLEGPPHISTTLGRSAVLQNYTCTHVHVCIYMYMYMCMTGQQNMQLFFFFNDGLRIHVVLFCCTNILESRGTNYGCIPFNPLPKDFLCTHTVGNQQTWIYFWAVETVSLFFITEVGNAVS